jgi:flagellar hook-length control protein FliK
MPADPTRPAANGTGQPVSSWTVAGKRAGTGSAIAHDQLANPVQAGRPQLHPNTGSGTGSGDRQHADGRLATPVAADPTAPNAPSGSPVFTLTDSQSMAAAQSATAPATASQPTSSQPTSSQPPAGQQQAAPQVSHQLAAPVLSLRTAGNGSHQLTIALHPAELGPVNVHVRILGDSMSIQLASTSEGAHDALREALPQLRQELQAAGLPSVDLSLDLGGAPSGGQHAQTGAEQQAPSYRANQPVEQPIRAPRRPTATTTESGLDRWL